MKREIVDQGPVVFRNELKQAAFHPPKVSVIVPVYNEEKLIVRCLDSICGQSLSDIEIICVDDGSEDGTHDLLREYMKTDERLTVIRQSNSGAGEARNTGIRYSSGEYLYFLDADDFIDSRALELVTDCADKAQADIVIFDAFHIDENSGEISHSKAYLFPRYADKEIFSPDEAGEYLFMLTGASVWNKLYRSDYIKGNGMLFQQLQGADDTFFSMLSLTFARRIALCKKCLVFYTINRRISQMAMVDKYPFNQAKALLMVKQVLIEHGIFERYEQCFVNRVAQNLIKNISYINTYSVFQSAFQTYKESLIRKLGVSDRKKDYFFREELYSDIQFILQNDCSEDVFHKRKEFLSISRKKGAIQMKDVEVSIVIPVYNAEPYLAQCLDSLLNQTFQNMEILCVNDGSDDGSTELLREYQKKNPKIRLFEQKNQGAGTARNCGLSYAIGKYVIFLDADDFFDSDLIQKVYSQAERTNADIVIFDIFRLDNQTKELKTPRMHLNQEHIPQREVFSANDILASVFQLTLGVIWNKFYRRAFLCEKNLKFQWMTGSGGVFFSFAALLSAERISVVNERLLYYRSNNPTSSVGQISNHPLCFMEAWGALHKIVSEKCCPELSKSFSNAFCLYAKHRLSEFKSRDAFQQAFRLLKDVTFFDFGFEGGDRENLLSDESVEWVTDVEMLDENDYVRKYGLEISPGA